MTEQQQTPTVCPHGSLQRACLVCEVTAERDAALQRAERLQTVRDDCVANEAALIQRAEQAEAALDAARQGEAASRYDFTRRIGTDEEFHATYRRAWDLADVDGVGGSFTLLVTLAFDTLIAERDAALARGERAEQALALAEQSIASATGGVYCTQCGDQLITDGDDNLCWVCVGTLKSRVEAAWREVERMKDATVHAGAVAYQESMDLRAALATAERERDEALGERKREAGEERDRLLELLREGGAAMMTLKQLWCALRGHAGVRYLGCYVLECKRCGHRFPV